MLNFIEEIGKEVRVETTSTEEAAATSQEIAKSTSIAAGATAAASTLFTSSLFAFLALATSPTTLSVETHSFITPGRFFAVFF